MLDDYLVEIHLLPNFLLAFKVAMELEVFEGEAAAATPTTVSLLFEARKSFTLNSCFKCKFYARTLETGNLRFIYIVQIVLYNG